MAALTASPAHSMEPPLLWGQELYSDAQVSAKQMSSNQVAHPTRALLDSECGLFSVTFLTPTKKINVKSVTNFNSTVLLLTLPRCVDGDLLAVKMIYVKFQQELPKEKTLVPKCATAFQIKPARDQFSCLKKKQKPWSIGGWNLCDFYCTVEWKQLLLHSWPVGMKSAADRLPGFNETSGAP